jgi:SAM-dependent methyltransferase
VVGDAQTYAFTPGAFEVVVSQFGLMFFDDPVSAFSNLRRSLAPGGRLVFVSWQGLPANEWLNVVAGEVANIVEVPEFGGLANGPGMFALMDPDETAALLDAAGSPGWCSSRSHRPSSSAGAARSMSRWTSCSGWGWSAVWSAGRSRTLMTGSSTLSACPSPNTTSPESG